MVIAEYLRDCGYKVVEGVSASDVLTVLGAGRKLNVILAEIHLAGTINGFELARQVREDHPDIDVILTSGVTKAADTAGDLCDDATGKAIRAAGDRSTHQPVARTMANVPQALSCSLGTTAFLNPGTYWQNGQFFTDDLAQKTRPGNAD